VRNRFTSPRGGRRGCLCKNGTYSSKCCKGKLHQQGIGATIGQSEGTIINTNNKVYELTSNVNNINEGESVVITLTTQNVVDGVNVPYIITGVDANDIDVPLSGNFTINNNTATLTITAVEDLTTEGAETLELSLVGLATSIEVGINDTSLLLSAYPNTSVAYSVRKIKNNYTGALIRVRKDITGNPERDVLPDANGEVSDNSPLVGSGQSLGQFRGNAQLFVVRFYDQENNIDARQSSASSQPENNNGDIAYVEDYLEATDDNSLSFTDGTNNTDFTILTEVIFDGFNSRNRAWLVSKRENKNVGSGQEWQLFWVNSLGLSFFIWDDNGNSFNLNFPSFQPTIGQKYILGVTKNGNQLDLFLGGLIVATTTIPSGFKLFNGTAPVKLGNETFGPDLNFVGRQNTAIIWKGRGLSASEIADITNNYL